MLPTSAKNESQTGKNPVEGSIRTCIGCRAAERPDELVRLIQAPDGEIVADLVGKSFGRGVEGSFCLRR